MRYFFTFLLFTFVSFAPGMCTCEDFDNAVFALVDCVDNTYLFRGKLPEKDGQFCYDAIENDARETLAQYGIELSSNIYLICVSLLNSTEASKIEIENDWFAQNPDKGCLWRYPLFGSMIDPRYLPSPIRKMSFPLDPDGLQYLIKNLRNLVNTKGPEGTDIVIYMHCNAGKDRTGEAAACYLMQYHGYSFKQAVALDHQIAQRNIRWMSTNGIRWYAYYLKQVHHIQTVGHVH